MNLAELRALRRKAWEEMKRLQDLAEKEKRSFTADEQTQYTKAEADLEKHDVEIKECEERQARADKLRATEERITEADKAEPASKPDPAKRAGQTPPDVRSTPEYAAAFELALRGNFGEAQARADTLQVGLVSKGGYLQPPQQFVAELIKAIDETVFVDTHARHFRLEQAESLGVPTLDTDIDDAAWTTELQAGDQGDITVGKRELRPHPVAKYVNTSKTLARVSAFPLATLIRDRLAYKFGITRETAFMTGNGVQRPLGVFTASDDGVPTSRDVTMSGATSLTFDDLIDAKHEMKEAHRRTARWVFHGSLIKYIRKLKDGEGRYIWVPGVGAGAAPSTILDLPYDESAYAPYTMTAGLYVGALCNWQFYWIADALDLTIQVLVELLALSNQDVFVGRMETDGRPVLAEAFVRLKMGS